jgi:hypothetical protein
MTKKQLKAEQYKEIAKKFLADLFESGPESEGGISIWNEPQINKKEEETRTDLMEPSLARTSKRPTRAAPKVPEGRTKTKDSVTKDKTNSPTKDEET